MKTNNKLTKLEKINAILFILEKKYNCIIYKNITIKNINRFRQEIIFN